MNIAIITSPNFPIPPFSGYGSTQREVYDLAIGLAARGHRIYVFGSGDSTIAQYHENIQLIPTCPRACTVDGVSKFDDLLVQYETIENSIIDTLELFINEHRIDVINLRWEKISLVQRVAALSIPTLVSIPSCLQPSKISEMYHEQGVCAGRLAYNVLTRAQKRSLGDFPWLRIIPYGISMDRAPFEPVSLKDTKRIPRIPILQHLKERGSDYLLHLATIAPRKGQRTSLQIAKGVGLPLIIAGNVNSHAKRDPLTYYKQLLAEADDNVYFFGVADEAQKWELMSFARATLFCSGFEEPTFAEPFGRVLAESAATGTPVVGYRYGSFPELIEEGITGLGFDTIQEAIAQVKQVHLLNRSTCSKAARSRLSCNEFIKVTENTLEQLLDKAYENVAA